MAILRSGKLGLWFMYAYFFSLPSCLMVLVVGVWWPLAIATSLLVWVNILEMMLGMDDSESQQIVER